MFGLLLLLCFVVLSRRTLAETLELLEKQVQCPICLETYRNPKALACLHAYCQECIQRLLLKQQRHQEVECPQCRSVIAVTGNDPSSLPTVFFINGLIEVCDILKKAESNEIACQNCSEAKATCFCHTCGFICASCTNDHKKKKAYGSHPKTVPISEMREGAMIQLPIKKPPASTCREHEGELMKLYCFECEQLICRDCTLVDHAGHKYKFVKGVADGFREEVLSSLVPLRDTHASITTAIARVEDSKKEIRDQGTNIATTITQSFEEFRAILNNREQALLQQAQEVVGRKVGVLDRQQEDLQLALATLNSLVGFIERTAENASDEEFISLKQQMTSRAQEIGQKYKNLKLAPAEVANIKRAVPQADSLHEFCRKQSAVYVFDAVASKCDVSGPGLQSATVKQVSKFTVCTHDIHGQPPPVQQNVSAKLKSLVDGSVLQATVVSQTPSVYQVSYTPTIRGHHQLTVRVNNTEIGTFQVFVQDIQLVHMSAPVIRRCVVILGKSGAGKSTIANHLVGHDPLSSSEPPFQVPKEVSQSGPSEIKHKVVRLMQGNISYEITVVDTIGFFNTEITTTIDVILDKFKTYMKDIDGINIALFVMKKGHFTHEEQSVFAFFNRYHEISSFSALAITGCENDDTESQAEFVKELKVDNIRHIAAQMKKGIYPVGFPPIDRMLPMLRNVYLPQMMEDRCTLQNLIIQADKFLSTKKLMQFLRIQKQGEGCTLH